VTKWAVLTMMAVTRASGITALDIGIKSPDDSRRQPDTHVTAIATNLCCSNSLGVRLSWLSLPPD
jgi:hypothetical protein